MRRKNHKAPERLYAVTVADVAAEGKCIVRTEEGVIFVENPTGGPGVAPGDVVDLRVTNKKKQYREAVAERVIERSALRTDPFCEHFGTCGGCKWQHIQYDEQLRFKQQQVVDHLTRIGKVALPMIRPILAAHPTEYYRNKLEFTCADGRWLTQAEAATDLPMDPRAVGFHVPGRFDKVLPIHHCYLQPDPSNAIRQAVTDYVFANDMSLYNLKQHVGFLRTLIIRTAGGLNGAPGQAHRSNRGRAPPPRSAGLSRPPSPRSDPSTRPPSTRHRLHASTHMAPWCRGGRDKRIENVRHRCPYISSVIEPPPPTAITDIVRSPVTHRCHVGMIHPGYGRNTGLIPPRPSSGCTI